MVKRYDCAFDGGDFIGLQESDDGVVVSYLSYQEIEAKCAVLAAELKQSQIDLDCYKHGMEQSNKRLTEIAAENAALKAAFNPEVIPEEAVEAFMETAIMDHDWNETAEWSWVENETDVIRAVLEAIKPNTPATDAWVNEQRATGATRVETNIRACYEEFPESSRDIVDECIQIAANTAAQLRGSRV